MKIAFLTLGCKVNSYETEKMKQQFEASGHDIVAFSESADVYVVNTCTVTNIADRKSRKMLHRARRMNDHAVVVAAGCYVDSAKQKGEADESVDIFLPNSEKENIVSLVEEAVQARLNSQDYGKTLEKRPTNIPEHGMMSELAADEEHTRAYIKIQNGCNQYCTYCIIPYVRGRLTSREDEDILDEVQQLAVRGYHEIVVTGIHLSSFGVDRQEENPDANAFLKLEGKPLLQLLDRIARIPGIERIRLGSLEPRIITEDFARELSQIPGICPHFHLSLQSGCDTVLKRMNRHYRAKEYLERVEILRKYFTNPAITTDIIVGFPQETQEEFEITCRFAREVAFAQIHVFKYSRRQGTIADAMDGQVRDEEKAKRSDVLLEIEAELEKRYQESFLGDIQEVLFEEISRIEGKDYLVGYNTRYVRIAVPAQDIENPREKCNQIQSVKIQKPLTSEILMGKII